MRGARRTVLYFLCLAAAQHRPSLHQPFEAAPGQGDSLRSPVAVSFDKTVSARGPGNHFIGEISNALDHEIEPPPIASGKHAGCLEVARNHPRREGMIGDLMRTSPRFDQSCIPRDSNRKGDSASRRKASVAVASVRKKRLRRKKQ